MAKGRYITPFELNVIRVGVATGQGDARIAEFLGRSRSLIHHHRKKLEREGTLGNLPFGFVVDELGSARDGEE